MPIKNDKNLPYGYLNPISVQYNPGKSELNLNVFSFFQTLKEITKEKFKPDILAGNVEYKAIVFKTLDEKQLGGNNQLNSLSEEFGIKVNQIRVIAKIPELHSHLPDPRDENDFEILSMYPIFIGSKNLPAPIAGDLIRVTFQNIYAQSGPMYLGALSGEGSVSVLEYANSTSGKFLFKGANGNTVEIDTTKAAGKFDSIGAWGGSASIKNPEKMIEIAKNNHVDRVDILVNDGVLKKGLSYITDAKKFHIFTNDQNKIIESVRKFQKEKIKISLSSWVYPNDDWINGIRTVFGPLASKCFIDEVTFDLEEPWILGLRGKSQEEIISWSQKLRSAIRSTFFGKVNVTCIVYADESILGDTFSWCDQIIPQCYSTNSKNTKGLTPGQLEQLTFKRYNKYGKKIIMGAAAWNLNGAYGLEKKEAVRAANNSTLSLGLKEVRYWALSSMNDSEFTEVISEYAKDV